MQRDLPRTKLYVCDKFPHQFFFLNLGCCFLFLLWDKIHISGSSTYFHEFPANMKVLRLQACLPLPFTTTHKVTVIALGECSHEEKHTNKWKIKGNNAKRPLRKRAKTNNIQWKESKAISTCSLQSAKGYLIKSRDFIWEFLCFGLSDIALFHKILGLLGISIWPSF